MRKRHDTDPAPWLAPTGDTQSLVIVAAGERTCLACGDTFCGSFCERCGLRDPGSPHAPRRTQTPSVPTLSYLRAGEWKEAQA